jgi:macrocin-O-methyltransferase TylF-like protien
VARQRGHLHADRAGGPRRDGSPRVARRRLRAVFPEAKPPQDERYRKVARADLLERHAEVRANFDGYRLLDERVRFLKGWFSETLPGATVDRLAVLRLDGDMYESTIDTLTHLYSKKLSGGGYVIVDEYGALEPCWQAVHDYRGDQSITDKIVPIAWTAASGGEARSPQVGLCTGPRAPWVKPLKERCGGRWGPRHNDTMRVFVYD